MKEERKLLNDIEKNYKIKMNHKTDKDLLKHYKKTGLSNFAKVLKMVFKI